MTVRASFGGTKVSSARKALPTFRPVRTDAEVRRRQRRSIIWIGVGGTVFGMMIAIGLATNPILFLVPIALLALVVIWALPNTDVAPIRALRWLFPAFLVAMLFWPDYLAIALPGLPWITMRRIVAFPMAFLFLISVSLSGRFGWQIKEVLQANRVVTRLFLLFVLIQMLSIGWSISPGFSLSKFILSQLYLSLTFLVGCWYFRSHGSVEKWMVFLLLPLVPLAIVGVVESSREQVLWAQSIPNFLRIEDPSVMRTLAGGMRAGTDIYRVQAIFGTALGYSEYLSLAMPFLIHIVATSYRLWWRMLAAVLIPVTLYMIILTDSRLGMIGFFSSFICYGLGWAVRRWRQVRSSLIGPMVTLAYPAGVGAFFAATLVIGRLKRAVWGGGETQASTDARAEQYRQGIELLMGRPWGFGIGQGGEALGYTNPAGTLTIDTYYLLVALDYGIIGFIIFYSLLLSAVWTGAKGYFRSVEANREDMMLLPLVVALFNFVVIKSVFSEVENHPIAFMIMAAIAALLWRKRAGAKADADQLTEIQSGGPRRLATPAAQPWTA